MQFHWSLVFKFAVAIWIFGWFASTFFIFVFDPLTPSEQKWKDWRGRLMATFVLNCWLWPWLLPGFWRRYWFYRDMKTGKRPAWLIPDRSEHSSYGWILSDGLQCGAVAHGGTSTEITRIEAHYLEEKMAGLVEVRIRKVAPALEEFSEWRSMSHDKTNFSDKEDRYTDAETKYGIELQLSRGKYRAEFKFPNRSGKMEEQSGVTFIVANHEEYADA